MRILGDASPEMHEAMQTITDVFGAIDGGISFAHFCMFASAVDKHATEGDRTSQMAKDIFIKFGNLVRAVQKSS